MKDKPNGPLKSEIPKLAAPARRALDAAGITRLEQLSALSEDEIQQLHGIGPNTLEQLRQALAARGLAFTGKKTKGE